MTDTLQRLGQEYDGEAVREADEHYTVAMDRRPKEIGGVKVGPGLYRIHWKDGGSSLAAIGMCRNGAWWVAPTNWVEPAVAFRIDEDPEGRWSWAGVKALDRLDPAALAHPAQARDEMRAGSLDRFIFEWFNERDPKAMQTCLEEYDARSSALSSDKGEER